MSLVRSDHLAIILLPQTLAKAEREHVYFRDVREYRKIEMEKRLKECDWTGLDNTNDVNKSVSTLTNVIGNMFDDCFSAVREECRKSKRGTKEWWRTVNKITGRKTNKVSSVIDPGRINEFFQTNNTDTQYNNTDSYNNP